MIPILVLKTENKVIYNKSNLNCKTFFEEFIYIFFYSLQPKFFFLTGYDNGSCYPRIPSHGGHEGTSQIVNFIMNFLDEMCDTLYIAL